MCGILGLVTPVGCAPGVDRGVVERMRDLMAHRGPDGAGFIDLGHVVLAHRRLAVIDPTPAGHQPMRSADGRYAIVYNGELYNDAELRHELVNQGWSFRTSSDTETVLAALAIWGDEALPRLRGMYGLGFFDALDQRLLLARDPLGVKPLYYWKGSAGGVPQLVFASEIRPILAYPAISPRPDLVTISSYLTTIRTTLGERTLFAGVRTLLPGEVMSVDLGSDALRITRGSVAPRAPIGVERPDGEQTDRVRAAMAASVRVHLRSDVPICCLLSGGLDSSIIATLASREVAPLWTYCSGAGPAPARDLDDFGAAALVAAHLGTRHAEAPVTRELFRERWPEMVNTTGLPLSTPNEVAINEVAGRLRADGKVVTISGEGADELFAGYDMPMRNAWQFEEALAASARRDSGHDLACRRAAFQADDAAWIPISAKNSVLNADVARALEGDAALLSCYADEFDRLAAEGSNDHPVQQHLRFQRRINLAGLLLRLDSATMLASVEGRTPFADSLVAGLAESLPIESKFPVHAGPTAERFLTETPASRTKRILRDAFAADLPEVVVRRPKASFPLPFQEWVSDQTSVLTQSHFARQVFSEAAITTLASRPADLWVAAWPMLNIAMWGARWWG